MAGEAGWMTGSQMAGLGGIAMLGGGLMDYYGQRKGAAALEGEADRQAAEQAVWLKARQASYNQALKRANPAQGGVVAGQQAGIRTRAGSPALAAGGKALGLNSGQVAGVGRALLPTQIAAGHQGAQDVMQQRGRQNMTRLSNEQGDIDESQQAAAALYPMRNEIAKSKGAEYRTGGQLLQSAGMPLLVAGMNKPATPVDPESVVWGEGMEQQPAGYTETTPGSPEAQGAAFAKANPEMMGRSLADTWASIKDIDMNPKNTPQVLPTREAPVHEKAMFSVKPRPWSSGGAPLLPVTPTAAEVNADFNAGGALLNMDADPLGYRINTAWKTGRQPFANWIQRR